MIYLLAFFCPPLALLFEGKPFSALFNLILYVAAIALWVTIIFWHAGFLVWALAALHAVLTINHTRAERRTRRIVEAMKQQ